MKAWLKEAGSRAIEIAVLFAQVAFTLLERMAIGVAVIVGTTGFLVGKVVMELDNVFDWESKIRRAFHRIFNPVLREAGWTCSDEDEYIQERSPNHPSPAAIRADLVSRLREVEQNYGAALRRNDKLEKDLASHTQTAKQADNLALSLSNMTSQRNALLTLLGEAADAVMDGVPQAVNDVLAAADFAQLLLKLGAGKAPSVTVTVEANGEGLINPPLDSVALTAELAEVLRVPVRSEWYRGKTVSELGLYTMTFELPVLGTVGPVNVWVVPKEVKKYATEPDASLAS